MLANPAVPAVAAEYLAFLRARAAAGKIANATLELAEGYLAKITAICGTMPAADVRPRHLEGPHLTHHFARHAKQLFRWACDEDLIPAYKLGKLETPPAGQRQRILSPSEYRRLRRAVKPQLAVFLFAMRHTLARPQELRELRWDEVDIERRVIRKSEFKAKDRRRDGLCVRIIPLDRGMLTVLIKMAVIAEGPLVFLNGHESAWTVQSIRNGVRRAADRAGLHDVPGTEKVNAYSIRHTAATSATRAGIRDAVLAKLMGHADTRMLARYQHLDAEELLPEVIDRATGRPAKLKVHRAG